MAQARRRKAIKQLFCAMEKSHAIGASASVSIPAGAQVMDLTGYTVIPGLVGMHEHMFYPAYGPVPMYNELGTSAPRLYLACGVTTARTTGSVEPYTDLNLKRMIEDGRMVGPKMNVTGPYLEGAGAYTPQMHELSSADEARKMVDYWSGLGAGSFKAYMHITHDELAAAIDEAHKHGVKLTGHLCSIGFKEAAALGIDNLEHGLVVDTEFDPSKRPDTCPSQTETFATLAKMDVEGAQIQETIHELVAHHVAVTSTLAIFETFVPNRPPLREPVMETLLPEERIQYLEASREHRGRHEDSVEYTAENRNAVRARLCESWRTSACGSGPYWIRRRARGIRRSARDWNYWWKRDSACPKRFTFTPRTARNFLALRIAWERSRQEKPRT